MEIRDARLKLLTRIKLKSSGRGPSFVSRSAFSLSFVMARGYMSSPYQFSSLPKQYLANVRNRESVSRGERERGTIYHASRSIVAPLGFGEADSSALVL